MYPAAVSFDTHKYVKEFVKAGMPELQAEAVVKLVSESKDYDLSKLATKEQIVLLDQKIESSVAKLDQKIEYFRNEAKADYIRLEQKIESSVEKLDQKIESSVEKLDQKIESSVEKLDQKIESSVAKLEQKISHIEEKMATREDLSRIEVQMAKQDSQQKAWMMGIFLSIIAMTGTLLFKLH